MNIRLSPVECRALKKTFEDFPGKVFVFGSRTDIKKRGGDIDILLIPNEFQEPYALKREITRRFQRVIEQSIDIVVYDPKKILCREVLKHAKPLDPASL